MLGPGLRLGLLCCGGSFKGETRVIGISGERIGISSGLRFLLQIDADFFVDIDVYLIDIYLSAMTMVSGATPNALLGLLSLGPMSGYDIRQLIPRSIGHFWSESYGQIYPGLKRLAAAGLVAKKTERKKGSPDRHVYSLTADGREQLRRWLKLPVAEEVPRNELLLKLFFGAQVSAECQSRARTGLSGAAPEGAADLWGDCEEVAEGRGE